MEQALCRIGLWFSSPLSLVRQFIFFMCLRKRSFIILWSLVYQNFLSYRPEFYLRNLVLLKIFVFFQVPKDFFLASCPKCCTHSELMFGLLIHPKLILYMVWGRGSLLPTGISRCSSITCQKLSFSHWTSWASWTKSNDHAWICFGTRQHSTPPIHISINPHVNIAVLF